MQDWFTNVTNLQMMIETAVDMMSIQDDITMQMTYFFKKARMIWGPKMQGLKDALTDIWENDPLFILKVLTWTRDFNQNTL